jgi:hypothetical protein
VKKNTAAIQGLHKWIGTTWTDSNSSDSEQHRDCGMPSSPSSNMISTELSSPHARELPRDIHNVSLEGCSINRTLASSRSRSSSFPVTSDDTDTSHMSAHELGKTLQAQPGTVTGFASALAWARGMRNPSPTCHRVVLKSRDGLTVKFVLDRRSKLPVARDTMGLVEGHKGLRRNVGSNWVRI